ncbi:MAG: VOC family protein [Clostridiales bacterium]|jgi:predicted lactoylglutathione lyase|nr:VOC family protein [Clostridiales bacterium]
MINKITLVTLGVKDMTKSKEFYKGLGFQVKDDESGMVDFHMDGTSFAIIPFRNLAEEAMPEKTPEKINGFTGIALAHNCDSKEEVDTLYLRVQKLGGMVEFAPRKAVAWNGYHFYFRDLDGYSWEIAY